MEEARYNVLDIAWFVVNNHERECGFGVTNLRLQKLLYFIQAFFIVKYNRPCFKEELTAWPYGPVNREAYDEFKENGREEIKPKANRGLGIDENDAEDIIDVMRGFIDLTAEKLVEITHKQDPWRFAISQGRGTIIEVDRIRECFTKE